MKIRTQLFLGSFSFFVLIGGVSLASGYFISKQDRDALILNFAGRQRMLTEKMSKEALLYTSKPTQANRDALQRSLKIFKVTYHALLFGGSAPLSLDDANYQTIPAETDPLVTKQLKTLGETWEKTEKALLLLLQEDNKDKQVALQTIIAENPGLLAQIHRAVYLRQQASESRMQGLYLIQVFSALGGFLLILGFLRLGHRIGTTIAALTQAAEKISLGDVDQPIGLQATGELGHLEQAFERMRKSTQKAMEAMEAEL